MFLASLLTGVLKKVPDTGENITKTMKMSRGEGIKLAIMMSLW